MIDRLERELCTGCGACVQVCPKSCITMDRDVEGFDYPDIDASMCVRCGLCEKVCPQLSDKKPFHEHIEAYAAKSLNGELLSVSSSGAIFAEAAKKIIEDGGVVFGTAWKDRASVGVIAIEDIRDLPRLQGSKYLQADTGESYRMATKYLKDGRKVLFSGTPCQIAGLYGYLGKEYDNLYTTDLICHGIPSPGFFRQYVRYLEEKYRQPLERWSFRDKSVEGWGSTDVIVFKRLKLKRRELMEPYTMAFQKGLICRESCYRCSYAGGARVGDLTIGDYWGFARHHEGVDTSEGISLLLVNTENGKRLLDSIKDRLFLEGSKIEWMREVNNTLNAPTPRPEGRDTFFERLEEKGIDRFVKEDLRCGVSSVKKARFLAKSLLWGIRHRKGRAGAKIGEKK